MTAVAAQDGVGARARERHRRVLLSAAAGVSTRGVSLVVGLISVPLTAQYLGAERYGIWVTISSLMGLLAIVDGGVSSSLQSLVAVEDGRDDQGALGAYVSSAVVVLAAAALLVGGAFALASPWIPWGAVFNVQDPAVVREAGRAVAVFFGLFLLSLLLGLTERVRNGLQQAYRNGVWSAAGSALGLVGLLAAIQVRAPLPWLVAALAGAPLLALLGNGVDLFARQRPDLAPRPSRVTRRSTARLLDLSRWFLVLQVAGGIGYYSDHLVITQLLGPAAVTQYAVPMRLFMFVPLLLGFLLTPLWAAYGEAWTRGDHAWVRATLRRSLALSVGFAVPLAIVLGVWGEALVHLWVGPLVEVPPALRVALALWALTGSIGGPVAMYLNGVGAMRFQALSMAVMAVVNLGLSIWLVQRIGVAGAVFGSVVAQSVCVLAPAGVLVARSLARPAAEAAA